MASERLKVFQAHLGFYDRIVAAPSQKAALVAWGATAGEFAKGFAAVVTDPSVVEQALAHPGKVLKRPFGTTGAYKLDADRVAIPKLARTHKTVASRAEELRKRRKAKKDKAAEREMEKARQQELQDLMRLRKRQAALEQEKSMVRAKADKRIARAKARVARSSKR